MKQLKIRAFPNGSGSRHWRLTDPFKYLNRLGMDAKVTDGGITEEIAQEADVYVLQSCVDKEGIALLYQYQQEKGKKIVVDCDDYFELNPDSPFQVEHEINDAAEVIKITMGIADVITTTTNHLADKLREINPNVVVLPNYMDMERWDVPKTKNTSKNINIGWAGSLTHLNDLKMIVNPLKKICDEFPQVRLFFCGEMRILEEFKGYPAECILGVPFDVWPTRLNGLPWDIGLAPLLDNEFNRNKSNIKWLEYGIAQIPGIYSPTVYSHRGFEPKNGHVAHDPDQWYRIMKLLIERPEMREDIADSAYKSVKRHYNLEHHANRWMETYQNLYI